MPDPADVFAVRRAGVLAHITSLPGPSEQAGIGEEARDFIGFLSRSGMTVWQMLPVGPVNVSGSPYQGTSVFAGDTRLLPTGDRKPGNGKDYAQFREDQAYWLEDYVLFCALKREEGGRPWFHWPVPLRLRMPHALESARRRLADHLEEERRRQYDFFSAWARMHEFAADAGVRLFGDVSMFAAHDSADVWSHRELFCVDDDGRMSEVAGVPPDAFSDRGQWWGCPQYHWDRLQQDDFRWWIERLRVQSGLFDILRLDHFRGFESGWYVPGEAASPAEGRWEAVPGSAFFAAVLRELGPLSLVAEDLGHITPQVTALRHRLDLPGMHVLQFAFDGSADNPHLPHNHVPRGVAYTGTHDNDTTLGWWESLDGDARERVLRYLDYPGEPMPWPMIHAALASVCRLAVLPLQDCLGLGGEARMNLPGTERARNWRWRCASGELDRALEDRLKDLVGLYDRAG